MKVIPFIVAMLFVMLISTTAQAQRDTRTSSARAAYGLPPAQNKHHYSKKPRNKTHVRSPKTKKHARQQAMSRRRSGHS